MTQLTIAERLSQLRSHMQQYQLDYYYVPSSDQHQNEYVPECWKRRQWISHFSGSAGDVLVGKDKAYLWTDGRYFLQAEQQLDANCYTLMKQGIDAPIHDWLREHAKNRRVGVDPKVINIARTHQWQSALDDVQGELVSVEENLIDAIWHDQPAFSPKPIILWDKQYAGRDASEKLTELRKQLVGLGADGMIVNALDAIAWLFNIRGEDVDFNPLVISNAIITQDAAKLYVNVSQLTDEQRQYFASHQVSLHDYPDFQQSLAALQGNILVDPQSSNWWIEQQLSQAKLLLKSSPIALAKALKNKVELQGMQEAHRRDAIAECKFLHWLENNWQGQDEMSAANKLDALRAEDPNLRGLSFPTISGFGPNGAVIHYGVSEASKLPITDQNLYLVDSGGQYLQGTTDITRTIHLGEPTPQQKHHYTLVLKGHLALRHTIFPAGVPGEQLHAISRLALWNEGLDFSHGTGHGVGCYLCVHEGPQRISAAPTGVPLQPDMIVSNEPGLYLDNQYGIRIENLCYVKQVISSEQSTTGHGPFYQLQDLTFVPYARKLINKEELSQDEINWINEYHQATYDLLKNDLPNDVCEWLADATKPL